jgi:ABC-type multidrug transport system ATPase subunit
VVDTFSIDKKGKNVNYFVEFDRISKVQVGGLSKYYKNGKDYTCVVDNISLNVKRHDMICIIGPSGSGKSTLLKMIAGIIKPSLGTISKDLGLNICRR